MVRRAQAKKAMVAVVDVSAGFFLRDYRILLNGLAQEEGAIFVPGALSGIITNPSMKSDFLHPNGNGYKLIAERIQAAIKPYLEGLEKVNAIKAGTGAVTKEVEVSI